MGKNRVSEGLVQPVFHKFSLILDNAWGKGMLAFPNSTKYNKV